MLSYLKQVTVCEPILKMIKRAVTESDDAGIRANIVHIPTKESVLRAVSVRPNIDTEEKLKDFIIEHVLSDLRLTEIQREHLNLNS
jgi:vacuolar-type H+-ATPase subunit F/Vma7